MRTESGLTRLDVVATDDGPCLVGGPTTITGEGAVNAIAALSRMDSDTSIPNVGYAGSNVIPIGTRVSVGTVMLHHPNAGYDEPCVFDMELAFMLAMGFTDVVSERVASDGLSIEQYHERTGR